MVVEAWRDNMHVVIYNMTTKRVCYNDIIQFLMVIPRHLPAAFSQAPPGRTSAQSKDDPVYDNEHMDPEVKS